MGWLSLLKLFLSLASNVASIVREKQLMDAGGEREVAKMLKQVSTNAGIAREIELEVAKLTPEEVNRQLEGDFRD